MHKIISLIIPISHCNFIGYLSVSTEFNIKMSSTQLVNSMSEYQQPFCSLNVLDSSKPHKGTRLYGDIVLSYLRHLGDILGKYLSRTQIGQWIINNVAIFQRGLSQQPVKIFFFHANMDPAPLSRCVWRTYQKALLYQDRFIQIKYIFTMHS